MAVYQITAPDGNRYQLTGPDGASKEDLINALLAKNPMAGKTTAELEAFKSAPTSLGDIAKSFGAGLIGGGKSLVDVFGAGTGVSKGLGEAQSYLQQALTPERQAEIARRQELENRAAQSGSLFQEAKAFLGGVAEAPLQSLTQAAGSSAPSILAGIAAIPVGAPAALALGVGTIAKLSVGALQGVGEYKGSVFDAVKAEYIRQGRSPVEAERLAEASQQYSREKAFEIGGSAVLGALDALTGVEPSVGKAMRTASPTGALTKESIEAGFGALRKEPTKAPTRVGQFLKGVAEEAPIEGAQGAFGQYGQNVALQQAGADVSSPMEGVLGAGLRDAAVGALFGGAASPLGMKSARHEYATEQFLRQAKAQLDAEKAAAEELQRKEEQRAKTEGELGVPKMLALPAPAKEAEQEKDPLQNPIGNITEKELGSKLVGDIKNYRRENNLPPLKSYSIEDIKDAVSDRSPEEQEGIINRILAFKTDHQGQTYTPQNILDSAVANNVATETKGWNDFLTRVTGKSDLESMTQPELHAVSNALEELKKAGRSGREEQLVLPEGSNATRFTQDQYNAGITAALLGEKPVTLDEALKRVQTQKGIDSDQAAERLLRAAAANDDLTIEKGTGFQAVSATGKVLGTYASEDEARRNHRRVDIVPVETELVSPRVEESTEKVAQLPEGYQIKTKMVAGESTPALYVVRVEGLEKNESQYFSEEDRAKERLNALTRSREAAAKAKEAEAGRIQKNLEKEQAKIVKMETDGLAGTAEHTNAVNKFQAAEVTEGEKVKALLDKAEELRQPLKVVPLGKKTSKVEKHTVIKNGKKIGTFTGDKGKTGRTKAEEHILSQASEEELQTIADRGGVFGKRAEVELDTRKRPGIRGGTTAGLEAAGVHTPEVEAQLKELEAKLIPMLKKFGLEQVGLNVVRAIENDADGAWGRADKLIRIALQATEPIKTMRHEALHALKELGFFTDAQWEALKRQADKVWVDKYLKGVPYNETMSRYDAYANGLYDTDGNTLMAPLSRDEILEEAIADAFGDWEGGAKPPPGMMAALFKRLQQFFSALRQALTGAGFESADEIFGKIERGELKPTVPTPTKIDSKMSLRQTNYNKDANRLEVSTARPTAVRPLPGEIAPRDPIKDFYVIDSEDIMSVPAHMAAAHNAISAYNWFPISEDPNATVRAMKDTIVDNLVWLYNLTPEDIRNRAKLWYNGANRIAKDWSKIYHYNVRQMAGVLAVLSPQKDWFMNTTLGERVVHVYTQHQNTAWSPDMTAWAESYVKASRDIETRDKRQVVLDAAKRLQGTKLKDMSLEDMAYFVRIYDETYHSRKYRVITPEGMFGDYVTVNEEVGEDEDEAGGQGDVAWGTYDSIQKAISILQDGSHENISEQLGDEHKVRNFYNNIVDPDSASGSVTIDTHAVAAAAFKALSGASLEVLHNFGTTPKGLVSAGGSAMTGASGTYGFIADAYREAAAMVGVLPREMQSITWEAIRSIFPAAWKSQNAGQVNAIYDRFKAGEITLKQARDEVLKISGGIKKFAWENDKSGVFPSAGATSFDTAKQEPRVLEPYQIREKLKINLSAAPSTDEGAEVIPGIQYLFGKARNNDMAAYTLLQEVASDNARHLLSGIENVKITTVPASGLFFEQFEPSVNLTVAFDYGDKPAVLPALKRFASNFKQKQIHVRQVSKLDVETEYDDGSYNTPVFTFKLEDSFSRDEIQQIVRASGLPGITFTDNQVVAYFMRGKKSETAEEFYGQIEKLAEQLGGFASTIDATVERLWVYGSGFGATQGYSSIKGDVRPGTGVTVQTAKRVAAYLNNVRDNKIKTFENADITNEQADKQNAIGDMYDKLPIDDMGRPIVRQAYEALAKALLEQYRALPITVSWSKKKNKKGQPVDAYGSDSAEMRKDILNNNRLQILPTTPESFGPEGYDFSDHPLLQETGLTLDGRPLLYNDLLRAVHDYFAHGMTEVGFGPKGEEAAWKNHMSITKDPLARWALTMETRAQNSYVNFRSGLDRNKVPLKKRGFAEQKAALLPVQVALTGNASVDAPMKEFIKTLSKDERLGSAGNIKLAPGQKLSLRIPETKGFKQWVGKNPIIPASDTSQYKGGSAVFQAFHGTTYSNITVFDPERGSQLGALGAGPYFSTSAKDASANYAGIGPDLKLRIELLADQLEEDFTYYFDENRERLQEYFDDNNIKIDANDLDPKAPKFEDNSPNKYFKDASKYLATKQLKGDSEGLVMPVFIKLEKPFDMTSKNIEFMYDPDAEGSEVDDWSRLIEGVNDLADQMQVAADEAISAIQDNADGMTAKELRDIINNNISLYHDPYTGEPSSSNQFLQYLLKELGYDGIIQNASDEYSTMIGVERSRDPNANRTFHIMPFTPQQVKSATGNKGTFDPTNKDIRYSLRTSFSTAEAAEKAAYKKAPPTTPEFKRFFGASKVKEEGRPQVMYHGSQDIFEEFMDDRPIFVTPDAGFAEDFATRRIRSQGKKTKPQIYPLWVRAETPFDYENKAHVQQVVDKATELYTTPEQANRIGLFGGQGYAKPSELFDRLTIGQWDYIENGRIQEILKQLGFDSFFVREGNAKNLAVFNANQVKSVTGNIGGFGENKDIRFSLKRFDREDLPTNNKPFTLPENTMLFHGSHETRAKEIEAAGRVLVPNYPIKSSGGGLDEGGLIFFGDERTAKKFANSEADPFSVQAAIKAGEVRNPGVVFETVTDRPYRLMSRYHKLTKAEAQQLNRDLGIPDYKRLQGGDSVDIAASRGLTNSRVIERYKTNRGEMASVWPAIFRSLGFDGFYDNQNVPAVAMTADNGIKLIGDDGRMVKYSLPTFTQATQRRVDETTIVRENKGVISRILESFAPESLSELRAAFIHRYDRLGFYDKKLAEKMGGKVLLADVSAEAAANMSDLSSSITASVFGIGNRKGGIPVYRNGFTTVDNSVKGAIEILRPLAQFGDPSAYQHYQFWAGVKRGSRFMADGREKNFEPADIARAEEIRKGYLAKGVDFNVIQKEMNTFNDGLVNYMIATGVISKEKGEAFKKHMDYIPFFRQIDGEQTVGPKIYNAISGVKPPKKLKGGEAPLTDYLESIVRNAQAAINAGMKNVAAQKALNVAMQLGPQAGAQRLNVIDNAPDTVQVLENGKQVSYRVADPLFINAVKSLNMAEMPFLGILSAPANMLRNLVTKDPGFMLANLARDSLSAWVTSGVNVTPIIGTASNFAKALAGDSPTLTALLNGGILGGYEFSSGLLNSANALERDLNKKYSEKGSALPLKTFTGIWDALEKGTEASDAATRMAVYDRVLEETGNEAEALYRALEVMNFNRKGNSPVVRILTAAIPFLNARIQGLDVLYRTAFGRNVMENAEAAQKAFFVRGATLMALSAAYFLAVSDDDEWKKQEQETKDNYWIAPGIGKFPTPFEVGFLFKTVPERLLAYTMKDDTGQDLMDSMRRGLLNTFAFNPIPQVAKPLVEYSANYNFFTGRPIVGMGMEGKEPEYQVGPSTTKTAEMIGKSLGLSPLKIDQLISGYTGTMGSYLMLTIDSVLDSQSNSPNASKRFEQLPVIKRFAADPEARGNITQYYELKRAVDAAVETQNYLLKAGKPEEYADFVEKNAGLLAVKSYVSNMEKSMKQLRDMRKVVQGAEMTADEKRDTITAIGQAENNMTQNIQTIKKLVSEYQ